MTSPTLTRRSFSGALALTATTATTVRAATNAAKSGSFKLGSYGGAGCTGVPVVAAFEAWLGRPVPVVLDFLEMQTWKGMVDEAGWAAGCWRGAGRHDLVFSVPMLVKEGSPTLAQGATGQFDLHYRALAQKLLQTGYGHCVIRIGWEFNGGWYPWTARGNTGPYKTYWRRIVQAMRGVAHTAFRFDWTATTVDGPTEDAYPGDDVVDIVGLDVYNQAWPLIDDPVRRWSFLLHHPAGLLWHRGFAAAHHKPRSFPEWGTGTRPDGHGGGDDPLYIRNMLAWMRAGGPVEYSCYWNYPASDYDARIIDGKFPKAAAALKAGLAAA